jgi:L-fuculose-phosphate aldolase
MPFIDGHPAGGSPRIGEEVLAAARLMHERGLVIGSAGNVSARWGDEVLLTPTRRYYDELTPEDLVTLPLRSRPSAAALRSVSREWRLHLAIYAARPEVAAIVHTHSTYATARSFDPAPMRFVTEDGEYLGLDEIRVAPPAAAGSTALAELATAALGGASACLLAQHGVVAVGERPRSALEIAAAVERQAQVQALIARQDVV